MPARVHAILVVRPDGRTAAALHLTRTLAALEDQQRRVDALTIVLCGADAELVEIAAQSGAESVISAPAGTHFAAATALATPRLQGDAVWLLAQDTAPEPEALAQLAGALELAPSVAFVAPKLVRWEDRTQIVSLGTSMTKLGRTVGLADGELDQGQHDGREDALAADVRGLLVRLDTWHELGGLDPALLGADEGLDLGIRARLANGRTALVPGALVAVAGDGVAGMPRRLSDQRMRRRAFAERTAQLHRRLAYAHPLAVPFVWLALLPTALWRTVVHLVSKHPFLVSVEWAAAAVAFVRLGAVARSRGRIRRARRVPWSQLAPLRVSYMQLRERFDSESDDVPSTGPTRRRSELRFFTGGGAWLVLGALVLSIVAFPALLAWPALGGGALEPLRATVGQLWSDAAYGLRATGIDTVGPADPFAGVIALIGSVWPAEPSRALVLLWIAALPLAALGGWFAATRVTERSLLRIAGGIVWMLAPTFLVALTDGRPAAVIVHLLLPWLFHAGSVAHRSWAAAGAASLVFAAVVASAPSLAPALVVVWITAVVVAVALRGSRGVMRLIWIVIPAVVLFAPLVWNQVRWGNPLALLADPGVVWAGPQVAADSAGRALLAAGFPTTDPGGWAALLGPAVPTWWVPLLAAPIALLALIAPLTQRWAAGIVLLLVTSCGLATAFATVGIAVSFSQSSSVPLWPGTALSLAWLGALGGALVALDAGLAPRLAVVRAAAATLVVAAVAVLAAPVLMSVSRGNSHLVYGPDSTLPAYVAAEGRDNPDVGTVALTPQNAGGVSTRIVWGGSETIGGHSTVVSTRTAASEQDHTVATLTADLVTSSAGDVVQRLADLGVGFVLLALPAAPESDAARAFRLSAATALNQRDGLESVGETPKGQLWRVTQEPQPRAEAPASVVVTSRWIALAQVATVAAALLLAVPTRASRREARRAQRVVGPYWQEGR